VGEEREWQSWVQHLVEGDERVAQEFWEQYGHRLGGLAAQLLNARYFRREEPEDVVQSVCRTFVRRAQQGQFELATRDSLWRLLCAITVAKTRQKVRFHEREKRASGRECPLPSGPDGGERLAGDEQTPSELVAFADQLQGLLSELDEEQRRVVELRLQDFTYPEIAEATGISKRTVRRIVKDVQVQWQGLLSEF
jgi:RNA polymerase sigma factor (sigma-70 family)